MISEILTLSIELSKNRIVNARNPAIITPRMITANAGENDKITHESMRPVREPTPNVILLRASIVEYSLGLACERM